MKSKTEKLFHPLMPVWNEASKILILGTFPSVKSRETAFYYGNPRNRFWEVLAALLREPCPQEVSQKKKFLLKHGIAVFDVLKSCEIKGSSDASIRKPEPNDFSEIFRAAKIRAVFTNGKKAYEYYTRYCLADTGRESVCLPSTSPANAAVSLEKLIAAWTVVLQALQEK
ncbi:DNA-deoxyinosine glycosylase [Christensenella minuta]|uniref:DNA-deoxyinosine glycosylase n=1 Tax=Christensenella minuta TaxID=626937 RepID=UPI0021573C16|nr:DNA-deoxyinosine glycosylase [Christensenella minuta]